MTLESKLTQLRKFRELREKATPGPWKYDCGNMEIETEDKRYYRAVVVHVVNDLEDRIKENRPHYDDDMLFIELAANEAAQVYAELEIALKALELLSYRTDVPREVKHVIDRAIAEICGPDSGGTEV